MRVLQIKWSRENGWHPHYHFLLLWGADVELDESSVARLLQEKWMSSIERRSGRKAVEASVQLRFLGLQDNDLYAWDYADEEDEWLLEEYNPQDYEDWLEGYDYEPNDDEDLPRVSFTPWHVARTAKAGCARAARLWEEFYTVTKGRSVVAWSRSMNTEWRELSSTLPAEPEPERTPMLLVESRLWNRARFRRPGSVAEAGLVIGAAEGVEALAGFWANSLGVPVLLGERDGLPFLALKDRNLVPRRHHVRRASVAEQRRHRPAGRGRPSTYPDQR